MVCLDRVATSRAPQRPDWTDLSAELADFVILGDQPVAVATRMLISRYLLPDYLLYSSSY